MPEPGIGTNLREIRERRGLTRQQLADVSGVAPVTIQMLEQHPERGARMDTLRRLSQGLGVTTGQLLRTREHAIDDHAERETLLLRIRAALTPSPRLHGAPITAPDHEPTLTAVREATRRAARAYHADSYRTLLDELPEIIVDARELTHIGAGRDRELAYQSLSEALAVAARTLKQVREHDLSVAASVQAVQAAELAGNAADAGYAVHLLAQVYMRQRRFGDAVEMCVSAADALRSRTPAPRVIRGTVLTTAAAAGARDGQNVAELLEEAEAIARAAASDFDPTSSSEGYSVARVATIRAECAMIGDQPDVVFAEARRVPRTARLSPSVLHRHRLDVAHAHLRTGQSDRAVGILTELHADAPVWLSQQHYARDIVDELIDGHRRLAPEVVRLADAVGVPV